MPMTKIQSMNNGPRVIHSLPKEGRPVVAYTIPGTRIAEDGKNTIIPGVGEMPDDVLAELLEKDAFTQGLFASDGGLTRIGAAPTAPTAAGADSVDNASKGKGSKTA